MTSMTADNDVALRPVQLPGMLRAYMKERRVYVSDTAEGAEEFGRELRGLLELGLAAERLRTSAGALLAIMDEIKVELPQ